MINELISICVPIYGVEKYIERCAVSLLEQTYPNLEFIFVNDCTNDNSIVILKKVIERYPNRKIMIVNHEKNRGLAAARNTAVAHASGSYIWHIDSDDYLEKNALTTLLEDIQLDDYDIISIGAIAHYPTHIEKIVHPLFANNKEMCKSILALDAPQYIWCRIIKKELYEKYKIKACEGVNMGEDAYVVPQLAYYSKRIAVVNKLLYHYDCRNISAYTKSFSEKKEEQLLESVKLKNEFVADKLELIESNSLGYVKFLFGGLKRTSLSINKKYYTYYKLKIRELRPIHNYPINVGVKMLYYFPNIYICHLYMKFSTWCMKMIKLTKIRNYFK